MAASPLDFRDTAECLDTALDSLSDVTEWFASQSQSGNVAEALAGATPALKLFGLVMGGVYLAAGAACAGDQSRAYKAHFMAKNMLNEHFALKQTVFAGHEAFANAAATL